MKLIFVLTYFMVTVVSSVSMMLKGSVAVGVAALGASALGYVGVSAALGSVMERRTKGYRTIDLIGIGTLAMIPIVAALVLAYWSDFQMHFLVTSSMVLLGYFSAWQPRS
jgi:hypothetical protein